MRDRTVYLLAFAVLTLGALLACDSNSKGAAQAEKSNAEALEAKLNQSLPESARKRALVLHSYHPEYVWVQEVNKGIVKGLEEERFEAEKNLKLE